MKARMLRPGTDHWSPIGDERAQPRPTRLYRAQSEPGDCLDAFQRKRYIERIGPDVPRLERRLVAGREQPARRAIASVDVPASPCTPNSAIAASTRSRRRAAAGMREAGSTTGGWGVASAIA